MFWMSLLGMAGTPFGLLAYMRREATAYEVTQTEIRLPRLKKPVTVLHLSDFHASKDVSFDQLKAAVQRATEVVKPDIICLTGDYMTIEFPDASGFREALAPLSQLAPTYAIIGNHDFTRTAHGSVSFSKMIGLLDSCGFDVMFNESRKIDVSGQPLQITGLGDIWSGTCRPQQTLNKLADGPIDRPPRIVLSHNPDSKRTLQPYDWDLMLCGHTHGGQLRIPFTNIYPILPLADRNYVEGLHAWDDRQIFITRGIGNQHGLRFNCRPEISVLNLAPEAS